MEGFQKYPAMREDTASVGKAVDVRPSIGAGQYERERSQRNEPIGRFNCNAIPVARELANGYQSDNEDQSRANIH